MRLIPVALILVMLAAPGAYAQEACGGGGGTPDLFGTASGAELFAPAIDTETQAGPAEDCSQDPIVLDAEPRPGMTITVSGPPGEEALQCSIHTETLSAYLARYGEVEYLLALAPGTPGPDAGEATVEVCHILTRDPDYVSPEGLRVGDTYARLKQAVALEAGAYFAECVTLPSGWNACFNAGDLEALKGNAPWQDEADTIAWFWK